MGAKETQNAYELTDEQMYMMFCIEAIVIELLSRDVGNVPKEAHDLIANVDHDVTVKKAYNDPVQILLNAMTEDRVTLENFLPVYLNLGAFDCKSLKIFIQVFNAPRLV
ncbi:hypothetical protein TWF730_003077 [Orbilia blumenaviensis]|uniref:Uncharacterized protein n=1 Tax=Orbilia blumenaviensis TaxID=1796055 RepID=A0AAV9U7C5_9PEZI